MDCSEARTLMLDGRRDRLPPDQARALREHLDGCAACTEADAADAALTTALARLPVRRAPAALRSALESRHLPPAPRWTSRRVVQLTAGLAVAAAIAASVVLVTRSGERESAMVTEAVNDHLRVLYSDRVVEIESGGIHQVKPWFTGRLDFAPAVGFAGDADFPLKGGSVAYFIDRKAAAFVFTRRLHTITLFVFRADGLPWPSAGGAHHAAAGSSRGFHARLWRDGDLGYALVSDVSDADLSDLEGRIENAR